MRDAAKKREGDREETGSEDESSDSDTDTESNIRAVTATTSTSATIATSAASPVTRAKWFSQAGLRVGFSSIPDQIYRKSLRKGGISVETFLSI